jgi:chaperone modulatory protein CbpM
MAHPIHEGILLDENVTYTLYELIDIGQIDEKIIIEMIEYGVIEPRGQTQQEWKFTSFALIRFKKALRLHRDLAVNWAGISLALDLLDEVDELRQQLAVLKNNN